MNIFVINCGSSSIKYQLIEIEKSRVLIKGAVERIGEEGTVLEWKYPDGRENEKALKKGNHETALKDVFELITDDAKGVIKSTDEIDAIGHRVVHGGETFSSSVIIDDNVLDTIKECASLAPLHNPPNITGIEAARSIAGHSKPQVAVFDTAFHSQMPMKAAIYGLPREFYEKFKIRKYGFHGTSHKYVSQRAAALLDIDPGKAKFITCHIGNGGSIAAVKGDHSVDTTMGLTPLEGIMMGTRCGDIDPAITFHLIDNCGYESAELNRIYNKASGLKGLSGISNDMRDIIKEKDAGNEKAQVAYDVFNYKAMKYIASYLGVLGGADAIVFTAGVAENNHCIRREMLKGLEPFGIVVDEEKNKNANRKEKVFSAEGSSVKCMVIPTNEELMIAKETAQIVSV